MRFCRCLVVSAVFLWACAENVSNPGGPAPFVAPAGPRVVYELRGYSSVEAPEVFNRVPFPYNWFAEPDAGTKTGLRLDIRPNQPRSVKTPNTNTLDRGLFLLSRTNYAAALSTLDGFSTFGSIIVELEAMPDPASLGLDARGRTTDASPIALYALAPGAAPKRIPLWVQAKRAVDRTRNDAGDTVDIPAFPYLLLRVDRPLDQRTLHVVALKKGLRTDAGEAFVPSVDWLTVAGIAPEQADVPQAALLAAEKARMKPVAAALAAAGVAPADLLIAFDFTTQTVIDDGAGLHERLLTGKGLPDARVNFDPDGDGRANIYFSPEDYPDDVNAPAEVRAPQLTIDAGATRVTARGTLAAAEFRQQFPLGEATKDPARYGILTHDADGLPAVQRVNAIYLTVMLPTAGAAPYPVVVLQHGIGNTKEGILVHCPEILKRGWACVAMDFPYHGERDPGGFAPLAFVDVVSPLKARTSFLQASADLGQLFRWLQQGNVDFLPPGSPDGVPELDKNRVAFWGQSLGAITGSLMAAISPHVERVHFNVGGGGLIDYVETMLTRYNLASFFSEDTLVEFALTAQTVLDGGDNINFASYLRTPFPGGTAKTVLQQTSYNDTVVPKELAESWARVTGAVQLRPVVKAVDEVPDAAAPSEAPIVFVRFDSDDHNLYGSNTPLGRAMESQNLRSLAAWFEGRAVRVDWDAAR